MSRKPKMSGGVKQPVRKRASTAQQLDDVRTDLAAVRVDVADVRDDLAAVRVDVADVRGDLAAVRVDVADVRTGLVDVRTELVELRAEVANRSTREEMNALREEMNARFDAVPTLAYMNAAFDAWGHALSERITGQLRDDLARHVLAVEERMRGSFRALDDKYADLPGRVAALEGAAQ